MKTTAEIFKLAIDKKFYDISDLGHPNSSKYMCHALADMFRQDIINIHEMNGAREEIGEYMFSLTQATKLCTLRGNISKHITATLKNLAGFEFVNMFIDYSRIDAAIMELYTDWNNRDIHVAAVVEHHKILNSFYTSADSGVESF